MRRLSPPELFWAVLGGSLLFKLILAALIPMTGDEAYFIVWGRNPALGYYDHPPMVGWLNTVLDVLFRPVGGLTGGEWISRLQAIVTFPAIAWLAVLAMRRNGVPDARAWRAGTLFLLIPLSTLYVITTTDTPLILFSFVSVFFFAEALRTDRLRDFAWSGVFLGLAFLSKYFAAFLGLSYIVWILVFERKRQSLYGLAVGILTLAPALLLHLYWNYNNSWMTVLVILRTRLETQEFSWMNPLGFIVFQMILATPILLFFLYGRRMEVVETVRSSRFLQRLAFLFAFPLSLFFLNSFEVKTGLQWTLSFYPTFFLLALAVLAMLPPDVLRRTTRAMTIFCAAHAAVLVIALAVVRLGPMHRFEEAGLVLHLEPERLLEELRPYAESGIPVATTGYTPSSILAYHGDFHLKVFVTMSHSGRFFDLLDDYSALDGGRLVVLSLHPREREHIEEFFTTFESRIAHLDGADFLVVDGNGFNYQKYREEILESVAEWAYTPPAWLPTNGPQEVFGSFRRRASPGGA